MVSVLYIEDDLVDQIAFKRLARKLGNLDFKMASSIQEALRLVEEKQFDLVLSDYFLAGDTVEDVLDKIKGLPIFLVSGLEDMSRIENLYEHGLNGHFFKPLSEENILSALSVLGKDAPVQKRPSANCPPLKPDLSQWDRLSRNPNKVKIELMQIFLLVAGEEKASIAQNLQKRNWKGIGLSMHKLKSNLRMMGYQPLLEKASEIENNCLNATSLDSVQQAVPPFISDLEKGMKMIENLLPTLDLPSVE